MTQTNNEYLLRIEAINLDTFILDSDDLSTIRGAGLLLLGVHDLLSGQLLLTDPPSFNFDDPRCDLDWWFRAGDGGKAGPRKAEKGMAANPEQEVGVRLELISKGASILLYRFLAATEDVAEKLAAEVREWLRTHHALCHATFAVDYAPIGEQGYAIAVESVLQKVRLRQMRSPTVAFAPLQRTADTQIRSSYCDIDGKRPGVRDLKSTSDSKTGLSARARALDKNWASFATEVRRKYGRFTKLHIYQMFGGLPRSGVDGSVSPDWEKFLEPAWDFQDIAARGSRLVDDDPHRGDDPWRRLEDKLAVLYIDGNQFGRQIREFATTMGLYRDVDKNLQELRARLLEKLCHQMQANPYWQVKKRDPRSPATDPDKRLRIETLLWGGDELIWVVPAWCGLEVAQWFFRETQPWKLHPKDTSDGNLTHSIGMVFCSAKSPIRSVVRLAMELAESAKRNSAPTTAGHSSSAQRYYREEKANALAYQVLESFDHLGEDVEAARERQRFPGMTDSDAVLSAEQLNGVIAHMEELRQAKLPRTRLHQIARVLHLSDKSAPKTENSAYTELIQRIAATTKVSEATLNHFLPPEPGISLSAKWFHLVELWDYLGSAETMATCQLMKSDSAEGSAS